MLNIAFSETGPIVSPTPLCEVPALARRAGVAKVLLKLENERPLGNFKILGGMYAGLRMLADRTGRTIPELVAKQGAARALPRLICASDGNHGLSVAAAARQAGAPATIYLHRGVNPARARRIEAFGASIAWVEGSYDDAVDAAEAASRDGAGILVADTSADLSDPVVRHVMDGYATISRELTAQLGRLEVRLSHCFVQAGVGGLAAALAEGLGAQVPNGAITVVEPANAPCVIWALMHGALHRLPGDLETSAEMLSCGLASAPAFEILRAHGARGVTVGEAGLAAAPRLLAETAGVATTPSGAAGLAGLLRVAADPALRAMHALRSDSSVLLIVTEAAVEDRPG